MSQNINGSSLVSSSSQGIARSSPKFVAPMRQDPGKKANVSNKSRDMYLKKTSAFKNRDDVQKQIDNKIEDQAWLKNLPHDKAIFAVFGYYFNSNMAVLSREITAKHAETIDRF